MEAAARSKQPCPRQPADETACPGPLPTRILKPLCSEANPFADYNSSKGTRVEELEEGQLEAEEKLEKIGFLLGVERVTQQDIDDFLINIKKVKPRQVESFGFGKIVSALKED